MSDASTHRVLIVDDDDGIRRSLARIMSSKGFQVETAGDGEAAVAAARDFDPDLLILDIRMPGIDGVETLRRIRAENARVSAIFMTAYSSSTRVSEAFEQGAISVLSKPLDIENLVAHVEDSLAASPVLIVDDDDEFLERVATRLKEKGVAVITSRSMDTALQTLRARPRQVVVFVGQPEWTGGLINYQGSDYVRWIPKPIDVDGFVQRFDQMTKANDP